MKLITDDIKTLRDMEARRWDDIFAGIPASHPRNEQATAQQVVPAIPFTSAAHAHVEPGPTLTVTPTTAVQQLNPLDVPAYGYLRHFVIEVFGSGGVGGTGNADYPWNIIQSISLQDVNGGNIVGPIDGYALFLANVVGGYGFNNSPGNNPSFNGAAPNPRFQIRVPVEISEKDALGALANQNNAANYKCNIAINSIAATTSVAYTTPPVLTINTSLEAWTLPAMTDNQGRLQAQSPPLLGTGHYISTSSQSQNVGDNTITFTRLGNYIRNFILVGRDATGARVSGVLPDPLQFNWDGNQIHKASIRYFQNLFTERLNGTFTVPAGVVVIPFGYGGAVGRLGNEDPNLWLATSESSRLEVTGVATVAGTVQRITMEVAPVETNQAERYAVPNNTGATPGNK